MQSATIGLSRTVVQRAVVATVLAAAAAVASAAAPAFTFDPSAVGLNGSSFTADTLQVSDYAAVQFTGPNFTDVGFMAITGFQSGGSVITPTGLNSTYGLYIAFSGAGTGTLASGVLTSLNYTLYGYNGTPANFGFSGSVPTVSVSGAMALASGSLIPGTGSTFVVGPATNPFAGASAQVSVAIASGKEGFFASPNSFYTLADTAFVNFGTSQVVAVPGGILLNGGGGTLTFAVPEPETYAMMLCGLAAVGFAARRRRAQPPTA